MVITGGKSIVSAFTEGSSVAEIYAYGEKVWPTSSPEPGEYYLEWWPRSASGSFIIGGQARWLQDYNGYYNGPFLSESVFVSSSIRYYKTIDSHAFESTSIIAVRTNIPYIDYYAFRDCNSLRYVSLPGNIVMNYAFTRCSLLTDVSLPELTNLRAGTFKECTNLRNVDLPLVRRIGAGTGTALGGPAFESCWYLQSISIPNCSYIDLHGLEKCGLSTVVIPKGEIFEDYAFFNCSNLDTLYLGSTIPSLGSSVFYGTRLTSIYVPISMLLEYKSTWTGYASIIYPY